MLATADAGLSRIAQDRFSVRDGRAARRRRQEASTKSRSYAWTTGSVVIIELVVILVLLLLYVPRTDDGHLLLSLFEIGTMPVCRQYV